MFVHHSMSAGVGVPFVMLKSSQNGRFLYRSDSDGNGDPVRTTVSSLNKILQLLLCDYTRKASYKIILPSKLKKCP